MVCCGGQTAEEKEKQKIDAVKGSAIFTNRSMTDCCMIIFAAAFVVGWIVIISVAASLGKPVRLLYPSNYRGDLCGDTGYLESRPNVYFPKPSRYTYGLCVTKCPVLFDFVCNADKEPLIGDPTVTQPNFYYEHSLDEYKAGASVYAKCLISCNSTERKIADRFYGLSVKIDQYKCFMSFYPSAPSLYRCLPLNDGKENATLAEQAGESLNTINKLSEYTGAASFFARGFGEMKQSWVVILISCFTAMVLSLIWCVLLRWILKPLVYLCILLILALLIVVGYLAMLMADDLEKVKLPGDSATDNQVKLWRALQYAAWILAAMYVIIMLWMIKRIKIAICIMKQGSRAFLATPSMVVVPPIVFVLVLGWTAFFIVTAVYIQTVGTLEDGVFTAQATQIYGASAVNQTQYLAATAANRSSAILGTNNTNSTKQNTTTFTQDERVKIMHAYNFFGFLWASAFCIMYGYFVMSMSVCAWYYSLTQEEQQGAVDPGTLGPDGKPAEPTGPRSKSTPPFTVLLSFLCALRYHLGTILFGSLLIAIVQFIRALMIYLEEMYLKDLRENTTVKVIMCLIDCFMACLERCVKIISKNAFIVTIVKGSWFCTAAADAMGILVSNIARVGILASLSAVACFILKVFIVGCNMIIAWGLINTQALTEKRKVESGLFPLFGILILSFIIASLFINVYECAVDTVMMCFLIDEDDFKGAFLDPELAELLDMFKDAEEARIAYEKKVDTATKKAGKTGEPEKAAA